MHPCVTVMCFLPLIPAKITFPAPTAGGRVEESLASSSASSAGNLGVASAMLEITTELAQNCSVPGICEAATLVSILINLVSDSRDNSRKVEKGLARCRSLVTLLQKAFKVFGKVRRPRHMCFAGRLFVGLFLVALVLVVRGACTT